MASRCQGLGVLVLFVQSCTCYAGHSFLARFNRSRSELKWGNDAALKACFGEDYKKAGESISHCFMEHDTHNTCCMMDQDTRQKNDAAGNPIGHASLDAYKAINGGAEDSPTLLTPWCTCFGSQVCSHYASTSGTKVKFVNDCACSGGTSGKGFCMGDIEQADISGCEGWARESFKMPSHATPGVEEPTGENKCEHLKGKAEVDVSTCAL